MRRGMAHSPRLHDSCCRHVLVHDLCTRACPFPICHGAGHFLCCRGWQQRLPVSPEAKRPLHSLRQRKPVDAEQKHWHLPQVRHRLRGAHPVLRLLRRQQCQKMRCVPGEQWAWEAVGKLGSQARTERALQLPGEAPGDVPTPRPSSAMFACRTTTPTPASASLCLLTSRATASRCARGVVYERGWRVLLAAAPR